MTYFLECQYKIIFFIGKNRHLKYLFAFGACLRNTLVGLHHWSAWTAPLILVKSFRSVQSNPNRYLRCQFFPIKKCLVLTLKKQSCVHENIFWHKRWKNSCSKRSNASACKEHFRDIFSYFSKTSKTIAKFSMLHCTPRA